MELSDVPKLRICHQVAQHDPSVIVGPCLAIEDSDSDDIDTPPAPVNPITTIVPYNPTTTAIVPYNPTTAIVPYMPTTTPSTTATNPQQRTLATFQLKPPSLVTAITIIEDTNAVRMKLVNHMVTLWHSIGFTEKKQKMSAYLNCEYSRNQQQLLNPSVLDTVVEYVMKDSQGE